MMSRRACTIVLLGCALGSVLLGACSASEETSTTRKPGTGTTGTTTGGIDPTGTGSGGATSGTTTGAGGIIGGALTAVRARSARNAPAPPDS